ncbi:expressed unknown protein [Seminavis robusta]|uniref:Secreted protein n=1 Tax=Seminavis robusta TaxID=568900 RepID=A0A9N8HMZ1_9STRA|nr:expressed unknown protein [Seminavis robusta]|eukprot:Sro943_g222780.1 n/a (72) ;mRNA; r:18770-19149
MICTQCPFTSSMVILARSLQGCLAGETTTGSKSDQRGIGPGSGGNGVDGCASIIVLECPEVFHCQLVAERS